MIVNGPIERRQRGMFARSVMMMTAFMRTAGSSVVMVHCLFVSKRQTFMMRMRLTKIYFLKE